MTPPDPWPIPARIALAAMIVGTHATALEAPSWATSGLAGVAIVFFGWAGVMRPDLDERASRLAVRLFFFGWAALGAVGGCIAARWSAWTWQSLVALGVLLLVASISIRAHARVEGSA